MLNWTPGLAGATTLLQYLTNKKHKIHQWTDEAAHEFHKMKELFRSLLILTPNDPDRPLVLYKDTSYQCGFGFLLVQEYHENNISFIQCGSTGIPDTQRDYHVYQLELTGLSWAAKKCSHYFLRNKFSVEF